MGQLDKKLEVKHHRVINDVASLISNRISEAVPGITVDYVGKRASGNSIQGSVVGTVIVPDGEAVRAKVREIMSGLRNPVVLKSALNGE